MHNIHNTPSTVFIVFGATGDLMEKKIAPALFHLFVMKRLPQKFHVIGFSRRDWSDDFFRDHIRAIVEQLIDTDEERALLEDFLELFHYHQGTFDDVSRYQTLAEELGRIDGHWNVCANKLYHLAVPPRWYEIIAQNLAAVGLNNGCGEDDVWTRVMVEKPFGSNQETAREVQMIFTEHFSEDQMYRVDHYLGKEMVQDILSFRFSNNIFAESWDADNIESIHIKIWEDIGIRGRGPFYETVGAFRDMCQSHMLSMLAFLTMQNPLSFQALTIRQQRTELLQKLRIMSPEQIALDTVRGQFVGYTDVEGVATDSQVETYFRVRAFLDDPQWEGVPIVLEQGKCMPRREKEIVVTFKRPHNCFMCPPVEDSRRDTITFMWEPNEGIRIRFLSKKPGLVYELEEKELVLNFREHQDRMYFVVGYAKLILDALSGDQTLFLTPEEIEATWRFVDPIVEAWKQNTVPLQTYQPGTIIS